MRDRDPKLIVNLTRGSVVCERGEIVDRARTQLWGLLGRGALPKGEGLLLRPAPSLHTAFMQFPIDAVFLDSNMRIVKLMEGMRPWRAAAAKGAQAVLELAAGESPRRGLAPGDRLAVLEDTIRPQAHTRVLLVAADRRFRAAASALLAQRGCWVSVHDDSEEVRERAARERAQVVVIDASSSLTAAARTAARLQTLRPAVGVVAVSNNPHEQLTALPLLPKWGSFDACSWPSSARAEGRRCVSGRG